MKEIDAFIDSEEREEMGHEEHLKRLLELNDKAALIHHPVAKVKRQKLLKQEITKTRRKLSMDKGPYLNDVRIILCPSMFILVYICY